MMTFFFSAFFILNNYWNSFGIECIFYLDNSPNFYWDNFNRSLLLFLLLFLSLSLSLYKAKCRWGIVHHDFFFLNDPIYKQILI